MRLDVRMRWPRPTALYLVVSAIVLLSTWPQAHASYMKSAARGMQREVGEENKGFQMLRKMGWQSGAIGQSKTGLVEPIDPLANPNALMSPRKTGIGTRMNTFREGNRGGSRTHRHSSRKAGSAGYTAFVSNKSPKNRDNKARGRSKEAGTRFDDDDRRSSTRSRRLAPSTRLHTAPPDRAWTRRKPKEGGVRERGASAVPRSLLAAAVHSINRLPDAVPHRTQRHPDACTKLTIQLHPRMHTDRHAASMRVLVCVQPCARAHVLLLSLMLVLLALLALLPPSLLPPSSPAHQHRCSRLSLWTSTHVHVTCASQALCSNSFGTCALIHEPPRFGSRCVLLPEFVQFPLFPLLSLCLAILSGGKTWLPAVATILATLAILPPCTLNPKP
jgi:hypothetical protein